MVRLGFYAGASTAAAAACLLKAFHQRPNFYSATVYLSQSNACLLILTNLLIVLACSTFYALQRILYGPLRPIEIEQLSEKAWYAVLDTLLAMPSFREDVGGWLLCMFVLLLAGKVWGWIGEGRVDVMEQGQPTPGNSKFAHARLATSLVLSVVFDVGMLDYCVESVMADPRPGMMVIFTFEFAILSIFSTFTLSRYCLSLAQARIEQKQMDEAIEARKSELRAEIRAERAAARQTETAEGIPAAASAEDDIVVEVDENEVDVPGWEDKRRYLFALEVFTDFVKLMIYIVFFTVSITFNGLPMHIMRDVYMTFASFSKRVSDYVAYRKATSDMNSRYSDATTEEIRGDACIVCRESMLAWEQPAQPPAQAAEGQQAPAPAPAPARKDEGLRAKKLPCGHILHLRCLKAWLERQQVCPTCRRPVIHPTEPAPAGQPAVPGAPGVNAAPGGQPGQNGRPARLGRARIFNFGPLRIGFMNGPENQIQNVINQIRNQPLVDANGAPVAGALPQGPNHLGLQVPYLNAPDQQAGVGAAGGPRASVPTQIQMLQIEQRLMQELHNLGIEQQQLGTLRLMEAELARLRAQHLPTQQPIGTVMAAQRQAVQMSPGFLPVFAPQPQQQVLQGIPQQQMGSGHEHLPQGMVLPAGWTVMPLQRTNALPGVHVQSAQAQPSAQTSQPPTQTMNNAFVARESSATTAPPVTSQSAPQQTSGGPRDESGSPLFVPTDRTTAVHVTESTPTQITTTAPPPASPSAQSAPQQPSSQQQSKNKTPWSAQDGWSFVGQNGDSATNGSLVEGSSAPAPSAVESHEPETGLQSSSSSGKGKGRAVEVEEAPEKEF
ncbi:E3 ubiquitin-protein ligase hrd1 [Friedmanniomyces endolithicus]|uniref:RING-type E3 ubiquitin transferase n=1 Tax=Friedmanniomyces endolithicus TaxID=329885 RepID=A0AAN6FKX0_9PEZI|nr:E3 ubiquitin-protein ligase hrd1 [Friedmanniomyces endolithicus]KAK0293419.1 E3 ubiquitin-protein ligase hrd1 [Friedmanniomyces endolithicus]KAK0319007.1 E3 ubiquitin-protein ligase hrd1 [Friedmanniomyces endolithicus]KAK0997441.1 E3 ubiquitin-protein ligase hrd1 [Friedmanniomyces endolithicus]